MAELSRLRKAELIERIEMNDARSKVFAARAVGLERELEKARTRIAELKHEEIGCTRPHLSIEVLKRSSATSNPEVTREGTVVLTSERGVRHLFEVSFGVFSKAGRRWLGDPWNVQATDELKKLLLDEFGSGQQSESPTQSKAISVGGLKPMAPPPKKSTVVWGSSEIGGA